MTHSRYFDRAPPVEPCQSDAMVFARSDSASRALLNRLNSRRKACGLNELAKYPTDAELIEYFNERDK